MEEIIQKIMEYPPEFAQPLIKELKGKEKEE